jgi:hypothetical protein
MYTMSDINSKWDIPSSMSELESLGLETPKLNDQLIETKDAPSSVREIFNNHDGF